MGDSTVNSCFLMVVQGRAIQTMNLVDQFRLSVGTGVKQPRLLGTLELEIWTYSVQIDLKHVITA
jgi:hypothetical protein